MAHRDRGEEAGCAHRSKVCLGVKLQTKAPCPVSQSMDNHVFVPAVSGSLMRVVQRPSEFVMLHKV